VTVREALRTVPRQREQVQLQWERRLLALREKRWAMRPEQ
jgi:hypothetical protein